MGAPIFVYAGTLFLTLFTSDKLDGFVQVIKSLEYTNEQISELYRSLYGDMGVEDDDRAFREAQDAISRAIHKAAELLSDVLVREE